MIHAESAPCAILRILEGVYMADTQLKGAQGSLFVMPPHGTHEGVSLKPYRGYSFNRLLVSMAWW